MTSVRIDLAIPEIDALKARWASAPELVEREAHFAMGKAVKHVEGAVKLLTPVRRGTLRRSIRSNSTTAGPVVVGVVYSAPETKKYASTVEDGAAPRDIVPQRKKALYWKGANHPVKRVRWPGFTGRHMFRDGMQTSRYMVRAYFDDALVGVARYMDGV